MTQRAGAVLMMLAIALGWTLAPTPAGAQDRVAVSDARITGDGPVTSWLGGTAERSLIVTIVNDGPQPARDLELTVWVGKGDPDRLVTTVRIGELAPDQRATLEIPFTLDRFSFGTHAVTGQITGSGEPTMFRAETSHVPWLLLLLPALILVQIGLVAVRDAVRRHVHRSAGRPIGHDTSTPGPSPADATPILIDLPSPAVAQGRPAAIDTVIAAELDDALTELHRLELDDTRLLGAIERRAATATERVAVQLGLSPDAVPAVAAEITRALLERTSVTRAGAA